MSALKKVIIVLLLVCVLVSTVFVSVQADAFADIVGLTIAGTATMTAGLATSIATIAASGAGMIDDIKSAAGDAGQTVSQYIYNSMLAFSGSPTAQARGIYNLAGMLTELAGGTFYSPNGQMRFDGEASSLLAAYLAYIWAAKKDGGYGVSDSAEPDAYDYSTWISPDGAWTLFVTTINKISSDGFYYSDIATVYSDSGTVPWYLGIYNNSSVNLMGKEICIGRYKGGASSSNLGYYTHFVLVIPSTWGVSRVNNGISSDGRMYGNNYLSLVNTNNNPGTRYYDGAYNWYSGEVGNSSIPLSSYVSGVDDFITSYSYDDIIDSVDKTPIYSANPEVYKLTKQQQDDGYSNVLDIPEYVLPDNPPDTLNGTIDINDYLRELARGIEGTGEVSLPVTLEGGGTATLTGEVATDIPVDLTSEQDIGAATDAVATDTDAAVLEPYMVSLTDFFPFCIPFDIYKMLAKFSSSATAPVINWRFYVPNICDETIMLDFSAFDQLAAVLRRLELLAFAVGLAFATKKMIQGGD